MSDDDDYAQLVEDCNNRDTKMTDWEQRFISDMDRRLQQGDVLTERQREKIVEIWERIT